MELSTTSLSSSVECTECEHSTSGSTGPAALKISGNQPENSMLGTQPRSERLSGFVIEQAEIAHNYYTHSLETR